MAYRKGEKIEPGIWWLRDSKEYLAEISYIIPQTGKRIRERKTTHRLDLAQQWRQTRKADALRGEIRKEKKTQRMRFAAFAEEYLEKWSRIKKKRLTYLSDCYRVDTLKKIFGKKVLGEITRRQVEDYIAQRLREGKSPATANRELCCLKNMLRKAVDWEYIESNPAWGVKQQAEPIPEYEFLTEDELEAFLKAVTPSRRALFVVAAHTGMRKGELQKLEWKDVNFNQGEKGLITLRDTKNNETRYIPMNEAVKEALQRHPKQLVKDEQEAKSRVCPLVFCDKEGRPFKDVRAAIEGGLERAQIDKHIRFHDFRHTFASHLVMKGVDLRTVAKLLGHKDIKMTMRYTHLAPEHLQAAVDVLVPGEKTTGVHKVSIESHQ